MFFPEKMLLVNALFPGKYAERVAGSIIRQGDLQIADAAQTNPWVKDLVRPYTNEESPEYRTRREKVESIIKNLKLSDQMQDIKPIENPGGS
jgi:hypothetical protein